MKICVLVYQVSAAVTIDRRFLLVYFLHARWSSLERSPLELRSSVRLLHVKELNQKCLFVTKHTSLLK